MPSGQIFQIDVNTGVYDFVWGSIYYNGIRTPNCNTGNCIQSCDITIRDADKSIHKGMWTCTSIVKIADGRYVDNVNVTFGGSIISKYANYLYNQIFLIS